MCQTYGLRLQARANKGQYTAANWEKEKGWTHWWTCLKCCHFALLLTWLYRLWPIGWLSDFLGSVSPAFLHVYVRFSLLLNFGVHVIDTFTVVGQEVGHKHYLLFYEVGEEKKESFRLSLATLTSVWMAGEVGEKHPLSCLKSVFPVVMPVANNSSTETPGAAGVILYPAAKSMYNLPVKLECKE